MLLKKNSFIKLVFAFFFFTIISINSKAANYYWVGGGGNWSDINHWAQSSGGTILHTVVPQITDDVFFDANSGFTTNNTIAIDVSTATCRNMQWNNAPNNPTLLGLNPLNIYGSLLLQTNMIFHSSIYLKSNNITETITTNNVTINGNINIQGAGGWTLQDDLKCDTAINMINGIFNSNNKKITAESFNGNGSVNSISVTLGTSEVRLNSFWIFTGNNATINATSSKIFLKSSFAGQPNHQYNDITFENLFGGGILSGSITAQNVYFKGYGAINGNNTFYNLKFTAGKIYQFGANNTQNIITSWDANTLSCVGLMEITSTSTFGVGINATVNLATGVTANVSNAILKNITITGSNLPLVATNSFDLGYNNNISFPPAVGKILYWVGGAGNWNDATHWSTINNGIYPSTNGCIPTPIDDVFFNNNSGFTSSSNVILLNKPNQYCKNMSWIGAVNNPILIGANLSVFGSLLLQSGLTYTLTKTIFKSTSLTETITTNGTLVDSDIFFDGSGGWTLQDDLNATAHNITHNYGTINTNNKNVYAGNYIGGPALGTVQLILGASQLHFSGDWSYVGNLATTLLNAGTSHIFIKGFFSGTQSHIYYDITFNDPNAIGTLTGGITAHTVTFNSDGNISNNNTFTNLLFTSGKIYIFQSSSIQYILNNWIANTVSCTGLMELKSSIATMSASINLATGSTAIVGGALISGITITGANIPLTANNSFDFGNNTNIIFPPSTSKTLYWVGGLGNWNDATHWSTINNGIYPSTTGCVPTLLDDVVFNNNSGFTASSNTVTLNYSNQYCRNMTWQNAANNPILISANNLFIYGTVMLQSNMAFNIAYTYFKSNALETITTNGTTMNTEIFFDGTGTWKLTDVLTTNKLNLRNGTLNTNDKTLNALQFSGTPTLGTVQLLLGNSILNIGQWSYVGANAATIINAGTSKIFLTGNFNGNPNHQYYNISFLNTAILNGGIIANTIYFKNNGTILSNVTSDTLIFTFGKIYILEKDSVQTIKKAWYPSGNPCFVTRIISSVVGMQAKIKVLSGPIQYDYIYLKDINATGSYSILTAETHSTNDGNNANFNFIPYNNLGILGLGNDTTINCTNFPFLLQTNHFYPNPFTTFLWQNASTANTFNAPDSGYYNVSVNYGEGCIVKDTIHILRTNNSGIRTVNASICSNQNFILPNGQIVTTGGTYITTVTNGIGCDSIITTNLVLKPSSSLTENKSICPGQNYTLPNGQVVNSSGTYISTFVNSVGCDSIITTNLTVKAIPTFSIIPNTSICKNESIQLVAQGGISYTWNTNATLSALNIANPIASPLTTTTYSVLVMENVCNTSQLLQTTITVHPLPLVKATSTNDIDCSLLQTQLNTTTNLSSYHWSPASSLNNNAIANPIASPTVNTMYYVKGTDNNGCNNYDSVYVKVLPKAAPDFPVPSIFTPNGDGVNDCFSIKYWGSIFNFELYIYNRWGQLVFHTNSINNCWDGSFKGVPQNIGAFVYYIKAKNNCNNETIFKKGTLILAR